MDLFCELGNACSTSEPTASVTWVLPTSQSPSITADPETCGTPTARGSLPPSVVAGVQIAPHFLVLPKLNRAKQTTHSAFRETPAHL